MTTSTGRTLRQRVEDRLPDLSIVGRRVALLLLDEHDRLGFRSATELARMAKTSDATVIRTIQQLGYSGLVELKAEIAQQLAPPTPTQRLRATIGQHDREQLDRVAQHDPLTELLNTQLRALERLDQPEVRAAIDAAVEAIASCDRILVNAHGVSIGIAEHAVAQLGRIGLDARTVGSAAGLIGDDLAVIRRGDTLLVIASGYPRRWHAALYEQCADNGARIVLVTDTHVAPDADTIVIRAGRGDWTGLASHVPTIATIEAIVLGLASQNEQRATAALDNLNRHRLRLTR